MQSHLENVAIALSQIKTLSEAKVPASNTEREEDNTEYADFLRKIDSLISQTRSAKVVSSKSIRQLEDLKSRSLTLEPATLPTVVSAQDAAQELGSITRATGITILKLVSEEGRNMPVTYEELLDQAAFSSIANKLHGASSQIQTFYNLTNSLTQTVEIPLPPDPPPWKLLAQNMRAVTADMAARETELSQLKDEIAEKNTTLAMNEKVAEELSVKVEILEKRVGESGGRREKLRELEAAVEASKSKEQDLVATLAQLQGDLRILESERENWKQSSHIAAPTSQRGHAANDTAISKASIWQIETLKAEIKALQSSIRYLRSASYNQTLTSSYDFLSTPIASPKPYSTLIQSEAKDVLKEMLTLISQPKSQIVRLQPRQKADRLSWRPARETSTWKLHRLKEEWEQWREWRDDLARRAAREKREEDRRRDARIKTAAVRKPLATVQTHLPGKVVVGQEVRIVKPGVWEGVEEVLGL